jgi:hypothetical protein
MTAEDIWLLIFVLVAIVATVDDIRMHLKRVPERDAHGRFRRHGETELDTQSDAVARKLTLAADEAAAKERI